MRKNSNFLNIFQTAQSLQRRKRDPVFENDVLKKVLFKQSLQNKRKFLVDYLVCALFSTYKWR